MPNAAFAELDASALIAAGGPDAGAFLHTQLTSDVASLAVRHTQYSGYCSPKGRLLATFLLWRESDRLLLQLPRSLCETMRSRLAKFVMRSKVSLTDATAEYRLFGLWGAGAAEIAASLTGGAPSQAHEVSTAGDLALTRLTLDRYVIIARGAGSATGEALATHAAARPAFAWSQQEIEAGIPVITPETQEQFVPQMVNLDLIGGVSYTKGCYPGQEIVARTHYLGRIKQRMFRIHVDGSQPPASGDSLYSPEFGEQACGTILNAAPAADAGFDALAVLQTASAAGGPVHLRGLGGPAVELKQLPYSVPS